MEAILRWADDNYKEFVLNNNVKQETVDVIGHSTEENSATEIKCKNNGQDDYEHDWLAELKSRHVGRVEDNDIIEIINDEVEPQQKIPKKINGSSHVFLDDCKNVLINDSDNGDTANDIVSSTE